MKRQDFFKFAFISCVSVIAFSIVGLLSPNLKSSSSNADYNQNNGSNSSNTINSNSNWYHYSAYNGGCIGVSVKEYWTNCQGTTVVEDPKGTIYEERVITPGDVETITKNYGANDERLFIAGHKLNNGICSTCHEYAMTSSVVDVYSNHGTKGTATLVEDSTYSSSGYGTMYKYSHTYNVGGKFPITNIFNSTSLDGINKVSFKVVVPEYRLLIAGNDETNYEIYASANSSTSNPVSTVITINRTEGTNDWVMTDSAKLLIKYGGGKIESASLPNRTTFAELFHNFTNWGVSNVYISDIMADKHVEVITEAAIVTGEVNGKTYALTESERKVSGFPKVYTYSCSSYFRAMFTSLSIAEFKTIEFYYDASKSNDQITFKYGDSYFGFHKAAGDVTGYLKATNLGDGSWKINTTGGLLMRLSNGSKVSELTMTGCTKLNELFNVTAGGWANTPIEISDILVTK